MHADELIPGDEWLCMRMIQSLVMSGYESFWTGDEWL